MSATPSDAQPIFRNLLPGHPAPWFRQRSTSNPDYAFDTVAGRYVVMCFFGTARDIPGRAALKIAQANRDLFDDEKVCFFGVSLDPQDQETGRVREMLPGLRYVWDFDGRRTGGWDAITCSEPPETRSMRCWWRPGTICG